MQTMDRFEPRNDDSLPRPLNRICHVLAVRRGEAHTDAKVRQLRMRIMPPVEFCYWFRIALTRFRPHQDAFLKMSLEQALERHEKRCTIVTMPIGVAAWHNLRVVDLHFHLGIAW